MYNRSLHRFALLTAAATLALLGAGGLVTSHGVGLAVPDWPNSFGYNMFFFPVSRWVGGIFYEHAHRLVAAGVGLMTAVLALWLHGRNVRGFMRGIGLTLILLGIGLGLAAPRHRLDGMVVGLAGAFCSGASFVWPGCEPGSRGLRRLGLVAFLAVVLQGLLGGLRVVLIKDELGIFHAALAQLFFVSVCVLGLVTSRWWQARGLTVEARGMTGEVQSPGALRWLLLATTLVVFGQLVLGATMRHQHAGLAIPDFPLAYGKLWPATDPASLARYNQQRLEITALNPITASQIAMQMVHRLFAASIFLGIAFCAWATRRRFGAKNVLSRLSLVWLGLVSGQGLFGAATIWTNKAADIATIHVLVGALLLAVGAILTIVSIREFRLYRPKATPLEATEAASQLLFGRHYPAAANIQ